MPFALFSVIIWMNAHTKRFVSTSFLVRVRDVDGRITHSLNDLTLRFCLGAAWHFFSTCGSAFTAGMVVAAGSVPFIATQTIPMAITILRFPDNLASNLGVLNVFCVSAQFFDTLYTGLVARHFGEAAVMRNGALWGVSAAFAASRFF